MAWILLRGVGSRLSRQNMGNREVAFRTDEYLSDVNNATFTAKYCRQMEERGWELERAVSFVHNRRTKLTWSRRCENLTDSELMR